MRQQLKNTLEGMLIATGVAAAKRRATRGRTLILAYHNVVADGAPTRGDTSLHLPVKRFAAQLDTLARFGDVVPLATLDDAPRNSRARFAITFDDAYADALALGIAELRRRGMPATVFVAPGLLGGVTWWDTLADPETGAIATATRDYALHQLAGRGSDVLDWARREGMRLTAESTLPRIATAEQLRAALAYDGLTAGSHTWSHVNLSAVDAAALTQELRRSGEWCAEHCSTRYVPWLSYPYGLTSATVEHAAAAASYTTAVRVEGGWQQTRPTNRFAVPRYNVPRGLSDRGFVLRMSGIGA